MTFKLCPCPIIFGFLADYKLNVHVIVSGSTGMTYQPHKAYRTVEFCPPEKKIANVRAGNATGKCNLWFCRTGK